MSNGVRHVVALQLVLLTCPGVLSAQAGTHFEPLAMPPQDVGSCVPLPAAIVDTSKGQSHRLVMKSIPPGRQREMTVIVDRHRRALAFSEISTVMKSPTSSIGTSIVASFDTSRMVIGYRFDITSAYPESVLSDLEGFVNGRYTATTEGSRKDLNDSDQRTIRDLIAFVRKRCPA